ncbi:MAG: entericidin A/B family lipoprotein [Pseudomonadota bacterium]
MRVVILLTFLGLLAACNTVEGVGRDIQSGGEAVEDGARSVKDAISN